MGRRLYRSRDDYWIAGVCGGLGRYFEVDSNPIRLAFVLLAAWNGIGVLLYLVTVLIVPEAPLPAPPPATPSDPGQPGPPIPGLPREPGHPPAAALDEGRRLRMLGWLLVLGGVYLLLSRLRLFLPVVQDDVFPVLLILGGFVLLFIRSGGHRT